MPPTAAATKVKDPEYSNWLKVSLALYYLTVGLHSFIQGEVDAMHQFLLQKLYRGSGVPKPQCSSCKSKDVKQNRNTYVWKFKSSCPSHLCDIWLAELLTLHTNPTSNKIYWDNCDVTAWPFVPWECAKLYMPRGQLPANTGPVKCDSQALLTLMANCKYFHGKLSPAGLRLTHMVSKIRNSVMHSEEMRLSDGVSKSFIQDITSLLEDPTHLKPLEECKLAVNEINKIVSDSIDVFFNVELEIIALMTAVNAVRQDMGKQEETLGSVEFLKEEYIQLKEQMRTKIDTVENRVGIVENRQATVENRVGTVEDRQNTMENKVNTIGRDVESVKEQTYTALQSQEKEHKEMQEHLQSVLEKTQQQQVELSQAISASVAPLGVRVEAVEEKLTNLQESGHRTSENIACKEDINKLRGDLIKVYKHLRCVQVSPIYEMTRCPEMDNVYVDLVLETKQDSKIKVTSYKQIFLDGRGLKLKRVYLRGKGGLGKTTFCRRVLHAWCNAHEGKAVSQDGPFQDEAILQMFDILFYMNLREVSVDKDLIEVLCDKLHFLLPLKSNLETLLRLNGDKILFILDGLDEMIVKAGFIENIVIHRDYPDCCFLVSSRPWKISQMELQLETEIDLLLDLRGFSERNAIKFAENIFRNCYNDGNVIQQFEKDIENNKLAKQLIHVPLLLVFLTHCWYDKRSLPTKLHELYISFLNMMADRLKEKYKKDPNRSQMDFRLGDTHSAFPKKLSETSLVVKFGEQFLLSLCGAAHHFLLSNENENSLVFEETELLNALGDRGEEILDVSLKLGLLSVTDSVSYLNRKLSVSFLHKTMQEFFTAACFILSPDKLANFTSSLRGFKDVQQNENIILFLVGLMPELGNSVLEKVNELYRNSWERLRSDEELEMEKLRSGEELEMESEEELDNALWSIDRIQLFYTNSIYLRCKEEVIGENVQFNVSCLCLEDQSLDLHWMNPAFLQILDLMKIRFPDDRADLRGLTGLTYLALRYLNCELYLPESSCLSVLNLGSVTLSSSGSNVMTHCTKLKTLWICMTDLHNCLLDLSKMTELTHLYMSEVTLSSSCCDVLGSSLTHCTKLGSLSIHKTDLHNCLLDLSNMTELTVLVMSRVTLSSSSCDILGSSLTHCTKLERLRIHKVNLHNCLLKISKMMGLTNLDMSEVTLSSNWDKFDTKLIDCTKLERLRIRKTNLHNFLLDLSNMTELTHLYMSEVTLSSGCCDALGRTLTYCTKLKKLTIYNTNLHNILLDLSNISELKCLDMLGVIMSSHGCDVLGSTLKHCAKLKKLKIHNTNLHDCPLDLSNMTELTELDMLSVRLSSGCYDVLGRSLTYCTKLELLSISNMDLHNCLLDFSNMTELTVLNMSEIRLSHSSCHIFCRTLSHCTKLKKIRIRSKDILNCGTPIERNQNKTELGKFHQ